MPVSKTLVIVVVGIVMAAILLIITFKLYGMGMPSMEILGEMLEKAVKSIFNTTAILEWSN